MIAAGIVVWVLAAAMVAPGIGRILRDQAPPLLCPECENGKPVNCVGEALDVTTDSFVPCGGAR